MAPDQMGMPAPAISPDQLAIFDQMRQQLSPKEFSDEILAGASQVDPQAVAEFRKELEAQELPSEVLDAINDMVDAILADPSRYAEIREQYLAQDMPEEMLPEQFDPQFFAALNMAVDQMIAAPAGPQAFAKGGIAELKPIAKALASYGRNGDTMLAHITPAEARMLRRRGGSGTINPHTGLPEFFLKKVFRAVGKALKSVGNAVKKFAKSTVGRVITTVALGFFLGPAAASMLNVTSAAGVAAVSGFVGSAGSTLAAGGNLRDALKAGAIGGLTAGAGAAVAGGAGAFQAGSASTAGLTPGQALQSQVDKFTTGVKNLTGAASAPSATPSVAPVPGGTATPPAPGQAPLPGTEAMMGPSPTAAPLGVEFKPFETTASKAMNLGSDLVQGVKDTYNKYLSPSGIQERGAIDAMAKVQQQFPGVTPEQVANAPATSVLGKAYQAAMPGVVRSYAPLVATGLGVAGLAGGFKPTPAPESPLMNDLMNRDKRWTSIEEDPSQYYIQNLPGVKYDEKGRIIGSTPWAPSATMEDVRVPAAGMSGIGSLAPPPMYTPEAGSIGAGRGVSQPYNTPSMYNNIMRPTPMPQVPFPNLGAPQPPGAGVFGNPIMALPFMPDGSMPRFAEGGEVEDPEYMMHGGVPHMFAGGFLRRMLSRGRDPEQLAAAQEQQRQEVDRQHRATQFARSLQPGLYQGPNLPQAGQADRETRAARFAQLLQPTPRAGFMADGGLASLAQGGYPRRTGQISGPGTEKSDSIPAMLSDGEFVMTAKAVRGAGNGSRRAGAKKMYALMHQLERNASRG